MKATVKCLHCARAFLIPPEFLGRNLKCPACTKAFVAQEVPKAASAGRAAPEAASPSQPRSKPVGSGPAPGLAPRTPSSPVVQATSPASVPDKAGPHPASPEPVQRKPAPSSTTASATAGAPRRLSGKVIALGVAASVTFVALCLGGMTYYFLRDRPSPPVAEAATSGTSSEPASPETSRASEKVTKPETVPESGNSDAIPRTTLQAIKAATVFIKLEAGSFAASGSGFVIRSEGGTGFVITNQHVVAAPPIRGNAPKPVVSLVFHSGEPNEQTVKAEVLAADAERDLAMLKFEGVKDPPAPVDFTNTPTPIETMQIYVFGFPFGKKLALDKGNPSITVNKGTVTSIRLNEFGKPGLVQIDGALNPGNSGGPVVDARGRLVGVAVSIIQGANNIGFTIPPEEVRGLLAGRVLTAGIYTMRRKGNNTDLIGEQWRFNYHHAVDRSAPHQKNVPEAMPAGTDDVAQMRVEGGLVDPLHKLRLVQVHYRRADQGKPAPADAEGHWPPLMDAQKAELKIAEDLATALLAVPAAAPTDYYFQLSFEGTEGKPAFTQPRLVRVAKVGQDMVVRSVGETGATTLPDGWKEYTPKDKSYTVWLPENQGKSQERTRTMKSGPLTYNFFTVVVEAKGGPVYDATSVHINPQSAYNRIPIKARIEMVRDMFLDDMRGKLVDTLDAKQGRILGWEYLMEASGGFLRTRIYAFAGRIYIVSVIGTRKQVDSKDATTFLDSYKIPENLTTPADEKDPPKNDGPKTDVPKTDPKVDATPDPNADPKVELKKFEGKWQVLKMEMGGSNNNDVSKIEYVIEGDVMIFVFDGRPRGKSKLTIDPRPGPKTIDMQNMTFNSATRYGIYRFTADGNLEMCFNRETNKTEGPRPTQFATKKDGSDGDLLWVFKREPSKPTASETEKPDPQADPVAELKKFEGKWQKVREESNGGKKADVSKDEMVIEGDVLTFFFDGRDRGKAKIVIDPRSGPKTITMQYTTGTAGKRFGIYRFNEEGDLEICFNPQTNKADDKRPNRFSTVPDVGAGELLWVFRKDKK